MKIATVSILPWTNIEDQPETKRKPFQRRNELEYHAEGGICLDNSEGPVDDRKGQLKYNIRVGKEGGVDDQTKKRLFRMRDAASWSSSQ